MNMKQLQLNKNIQNNVTLYANHLLVICMFFLPIYKQPISISFVILFLMFLVRGDYKYYIKEAISNKIIQACVAIFFVHVIWTIGSDNIELAKDMINNSRYYLFSFIIVFFVDKTFSKRLLIAFILGMLLSEIISYLIHFEVIPYKLEIFNKIIYQAMAVNNPTPFLVHYTYNTFLSIVVGILLYNLLVNKNKLIIKLISIFFIVTASINMILVGGRIGYVVYIVVIFTTLFLIYRKRLFKFALPVALLSLSIFFFVAYNKGGLFQERIDSIYSDYNQLTKEDNINTSVGLRLTMWKYGLEVIKNNFIFGVGTGDQMSAIVNAAPEEKAKFIVFHHAHNGYIEYFLQFGIIGLLAFLNLFYQIYKVKIEDKALRAYLHIINVSFLFYMLTNRLSRHTILALLLFSLALSTKNSFLKADTIEYSKKLVIFYMFFIMIFLVRGY